MTSSSSSHARLLEMIEFRRSKSSQVIAGLLVNSIYEMRNYPIVLINTVLSPLSFLLVITFVSRGTLIGDAILGGFIMSMFSSGMALQGDLSHLKNDFKLQDMIVSSPTSPFTYTLGMALSEMIYSFPALLILGVLSAIFIHPNLFQVGELVAVLLLMFMMSTALGFMLSTISSDIVQSFAFSRVISTLFTTIVPVYYPITYLPVYLQYFAYLSPTTYAAIIAQSATGYLAVQQSAVLLDGLVLLVATIVVLLIAAKKARWREV
jgi:ABC-2 type transport system permease protein